MHISPAGIVALLLFNFAILAAVGWLTWTTRWQPYTNPAFITPSATLAPPTATQPPTPTERPTVTATLPPTPTPEQGERTAPNQGRPAEIPGIFILAMSDAGYTHLFAYHPETLPFTRLTSGDWDDTQPALSPDGSQIAYASHRNNRWDIYILNLLTGETRQFTDDLAYDGAPAWSPDGQWLAYEKLVNNNLEIFMQPADQSLDALQVTYDPNADFGPRWHPTEQRLVFTSTRTGNNDIWVADLTRLGQGDYLSILTVSPFSQRHAAWSPDASQIAWVGLYDGFESIFIADPVEGEGSESYLGLGSLAVWDPHGEFIATDQHTPDSHFLAVYHVATHTYQLPPQALPGRLVGLSWGPNAIQDGLPTNLQEIASLDIAAPWLLGLTPGPGTFYGRQYTLELPGVTAPHPALNALAVEPFLALQARVHKELGWDALSDLENAFVPLTAPMPPGRSNDWLYTGRAFALNSTLIKLGWMKVVREDFGAQTYWRIYLRTEKQDGSQGQPITQLAWNFDARFSGITSFYEAGGTYENSIPGGYWIDFTELALEYGFERQPSLSNWRTFYPNTRFNVFAVTSGMDWEQAMLQLYPPEIFMNPALSP